MCALADMSNYVAAPMPMCVVSIKHCSYEGTAASFRCTHTHVHAQRMLVERHRQTQSLLVTSLGPFQLVNKVVDVDHSLNSEELCMCDSCVHMSVAAACAVQSQVVGVYALHTALGGTEAVQLLSQLDDVMSDTMRRWQHCRWMLPGSLKKWHLTLPNNTAVYLPGHAPSTLVKVVFSLVQP